MWLRFLRTKLAIIFFNFCKNASCTRNRALSRCAIQCQSTMTGSGATHAARLRWDGGLGGGSFFFFRGQMKCRLRPVGSMSAGREATIWDEQLDEVLAVHRRAVRAWSGHC